MLNMTAYLGAVGIGATTPQLFRGDDGKVYVVKLLNNRLGPKILVNELLACRIGAFMDLCFPLGDVARIEEKVIAKSRRLRAGRVAAGPHFASRYLNNTQYVGRFNLPYALNLKQMAGVMLFDHVFHNLDRTFNKRNLLLRREQQGYMLYAIDNSHLFRRGKWTTETLAKLEGQIVINHRRTYGWLLKYFLQPDDFAPYLTRLQALDRDAVQEILAEVPYEWLPDSDERQALCKHIVARIGMAGEIAARLSALIPNVDRGADTD